MARMNFARSALAVLLREGTDRLTVTRGGQPVGTVGWADLRASGPERP